MNSASLVIHSFDQCQHYKKPTFHPKSLFAFQAHQPLIPDPPPHTHSREDESYFILKGSIRYTIGDKRLTVNEGEYVYLPKDVPHSFEILSEQAEMLMWLCPAGLDQWFWENSAPALDGNQLPMPQGPPPSHVIDQFVKSLREYGVEMI